MNHTYIFGIDIGGTTVKTGLFDEDVLIRKREIPTRTEDKGKHILPDTVRAMQQELKNIGLSFGDLAGIGVDVPGPVWPDKTVDGCSNLNWGRVPAAEILQELTGVKKIAILNDANAAALGEMWKGSGRGRQNMVMVTLGTGVGGGIITNGRVVSGAHGAGGEIGHIRVSDTETRKCGCGKYGCLEQYASATGIVRKAGELLRQNPDSILAGISDLTAKDVFDAAKQGDTLALAVVNFAGQKLGRALSFVSCVADPEVYVIGGGVSRAGQILLDAIEKYYRQDAFHSCRDAQFEIAALGNDAGIYGAARQILEETDAI